MENYAGNDVFPANVSLPQDGDKGEAATFRPGYEGALDRTTYLKNRIESTSSAGFRRLISVAKLQYDASFWEFDGAALISKSGNLGNLAKHEVRFAIDAPPGAIIRSVVAQIQPAGGHAGVVGVEPQIALIRQDLSTGIITPVAVVGGGTGTPLLTYQTDHAYGPSFAVQPTVDPTIEAYMIRFRHESGANSIEAGFRLHHFQVRLDVTDHPTGVW